MGEIAKTLITCQDKDVARGTVAFGTNGEASNIFFGRLEVKAYDPNFKILNRHKNDHLIYSECLYPHKKSYLKQEE